MGGLAAETVTTTHNSIGLPEVMAGADSYVPVAAYDDRGRPALFGFGPASAIDFARGWTYDNRQQLSRLQAAAQGLMVQDMRVSYDEVGNVTERSTTLDGSSWRECFAYDQRQRLVTAFTTTGTCASGDPGTGPEPYDHEYEYSHDGNILSRREGTTTIDYSYPPGGSGSVRPHAPTSVGGDEYEWDDNGNQVSRTVSGSTETLSWDAEQRLSAVSGAGGSGDSSFVYDADGTRLLRSTPEGVTLYIEGHEITATDDGSGAAVEAVRSYSFNGELIGTRSADGIDYVALDNQGSVVVSVRAGTTSATVRTHEPYGRPRHTGTHPTDRGWIGQLEDASTGLTYLNARYYDPSTAVFISADPMYDQGRPSTLNPYSYGMSSPTTQSDPSGLDPPCFWGDPNIQCTERQKAQQSGRLEEYEEREATRPPVLDPETELCVDNCLEIQREVHRRLYPACTVSNPDIEEVECRPEAVEREIVRELLDGIRNLLEENPRIRRPNAWPGHRVCPIRDRSSG